MSEILAFLSIERSLGRIGYRVTEDALAPLESDLHTAAVDGRHDEALHLLDQIDLRHETQKVEELVPFYLQSAFVLGASLAYGGMNRTPKNTKQKLDPTILSTVAKVHAEIVTNRSANLIRRYGANAIADHSVEHDQLIKSEAHIRKKSTDDLADMLNAAVDGTSKMMSSISANLSTSRLVSYGFLHGAHELGIRKYQLQAVLDERTSDICRELDGRVFEVDRALSYAERVLRTTDPEELKSIAPFLKGTKAAIKHLHETSDQDLQAQGVMVPPFHPGCRTVLVPVDGDFQLSPQEELDDIARAIFGDGI